MPIPKLQILSNGNTLVIREDGEVPNKFVVSESENSYFTLSCEDQEACAPRIRRCHNYLFDICFQNSEAIEMVIEVRSDGQVKKHETFCAHAITWPRCSTSA